MQTLNINYENLELFLNGKIIIHCTTKREAQILFDILRTQNIKWITGEYLTTSHWKFYKNKTCYSYEKNNRIGLCYSNIDCYIKEYYTILNFDSLIVQNEKNIEEDNMNQKIGTNRKITVIED